MLVEDYQDLLDLFLRILRKGGFDVISTVSALDAQAIFQREGASIGILVSDIDMPGMSGLTLAGMIHEKDPTAGVVLMSGGFLSDAVLDEIAAKGWTFLAKPFSPAALLHAVCNAMEGTPPEAPYRYGAPAKSGWSRAHRA